MSNLEFLVLLNCVTPVVITGAGAIGGWFAAFCVAIAFSVFTARWLYDVYQKRVRWWKFHGDLRTREPPYEPTNEEEDS